MQYELVIFDNGGVLVDSKRVAHRLLAELLTPRVTPTTFEEAVEHCRGTSFRDGAETVRRGTVFGSMAESKDTLGSAGSRDGSCSS